MVIKSRHEAALLEDIEETMRTLEQAQMKLNTRKCTFKVEDGQFLGYQITTEGILLNQAKIQEFLNSKVPHNLKGVQEINGRLTVLGRFIPKSTEKAHPLFHKLKGCVERKQVQMDNRGR